MSVLLLDEPQHFRVAASPSNPSHSQPQLPTTASAPAPSMAATPAPTAAPPPCGPPTSDCQPRRRPANERESSAKTAFHSVPVHAPRTQPRPAPKPSQASSTRARDCFLKKLSHPPKRSQVSVHARQGQTINGQSPHFCICLKRSQVSFDNYLRSYTICAEGRGHELASAVVLAKLYKSTPHP